MDLIKIVTAGSVDDGKSTLIGRLLFDTKSLKIDQVEHIEEKSKKKGYDYIDYSLATDGLLTEREQGITIDVSHIFFKTSKRRFIVADCPGHEEYTRNMVTGSSTAKASIILLDARKGVLEQTKRHLFLTHLLGIEQIVFAVNKMDLKNYDKQIFDNIVQDLNNLIPDDFHLNTWFVPISALKGDNITEKSKNMSWYHGQHLLEILENLNTYIDKSELPAFQVQYVIRPKQENYHDYRGFAGKVNSGSFKVNDQIKVIPNERSSTIKKIEKYGVEVQKISQGENGTILLHDEIDISRGNMIVLENAEISIDKNLKAKVCWMQNETFEIGKKYLLQQGVQRTKIKVVSIESKINLHTLKLEASNQLKMNDIGLCTLMLASPIGFKKYKENKNLGAFILIDEITNNTAGVGFIE